MVLPGVQFVGLSSLRKRQEGGVVVRQKDDPTGDWRVGVERCPVAERLA
jgi:hypothetical protein